jgi:hypothetical protein
MGGMILLSQLSREVRSLVGSDIDLPSYRKLYQLALDAAIPAEQKNGRWNVRRENIPAIARQFSNYLDKNPASSRKRKARAG